MVIVRLSGHPLIRDSLSEEANDVDHETSDQVTAEPHRSSRVRSAPEWYGNPILDPRANFLSLRTGPFSRRSFSRKN